MKLSKIHFISIFVIYSLYISSMTFSQNKEVPNLENIPDNAVLLEKMDISFTAQDWGSAHSSKSVDNNPLKIKGIEYKHGVGTHSNSELQINLKTNGKRFTALVGIDDETKGKGSVQFEILLDNKPAFKTDIIKGNDDPKPIDIDLANAKILTLVVSDANDNIDYDHADWINAMIILKDKNEAKPMTFVQEDNNPPKISPVDNKTLGIHGPIIVGTTPGRPFLFLIPVTGNGKLKFAVKNLPDGLKLDETTGIISGSLKNEGEFKTELSVSSNGKTVKRDLTIIGGKHKLALTPPMGWNSWNVWGLDVDDKKVRDATDWLVKSSLAAHGFQYINIDDAWEDKHDATGNILPNKKFPDMKALCDYVHSKGLKIGIYSSPGPKTCGEYEGSYKYEEQDALTYAEWGIDYLKYDWCSYGNIAKDKSLPELQKPYFVMRNALDKCNRDIVFSLCQYGMGEVWKWGGEVGGNLWRTTGDITDTWNSMSNIGFSQNGHEQYAKPGNWNDPDMLVVGKVGWGSSTHKTKLTQNEQVTHISLWCLLSAPLLIGCDLTALDDFTLSVLTNDEVLDVSQDQLGKQAKRISQNGKLEVWAKELYDGSFAVGLFNRTKEKTRIPFNFSDLGIKGKKEIRDLWQKKNLGKFNNKFETEVNPHGAVLLKVK